MTIALNKYKRRPTNASRLSLFTSQRATSRLTVDDTLGSKLTSRNNIGKRVLYRPRKMGDSTDGRGRTKSDRWIACDKNDPIGAMHPAAIYRDAHAGAATEVTVTKNRAIERDQKKTLSVPSGQLSSSQERESTMGIEADSPTLDPKHALANIRTLVSAAVDSDDREAVHKILKEVLRLADKALPRRRRSDRHGD